MADFLSTRQAAELLGVPTARLSKALYQGRVDEPQRGPNNAFLWTMADVEKASWQLLARPLEAGESKVTP